MNTPDLIRELRSQQKRVAESRDSDSETRAWFMRNVGAICDELERLTGERDGRETEIQRRIDLALEGHAKADELMRKGFERSEELRQELKQKVRTLELQVVAMRETYAKLIERMDPLEVEADWEDSEDIAYALQKAFANIIRVVALPTPPPDTAPEKSHETH